MQVCIMNAVSRSVNAFSHTYNTGGPNDINGYDLCQHVDKSTYCFLDGINIFDWSLNNRNCKIKHLTTPEYTKAEHLNTVNRLHSFIESEVIK